MRGRLLLWAAAFVVGAALGVLAPPVVAPRLFAGPAVGVVLFLLLARRWPRLPPGPMAAVVARSGYIVAAAAFEELLWRGLGLGVLARPLGPGPALVLTAAAFACAHRRAPGPRRAVHVLTGLGFGSAYLVGGLAAAVLAHASYNVLVDVAVQAERRGEEAT